MKNEIRALAGISFIFHAVGLFVLPLMPGLFSQETVYLSQYSGHGAQINVHHPALYVLYLVPYPALIGMAAYRNWGRHLMLTFIILMLLLTFLSGASVSGPPETFVSGVVVLIDGALLGLAYLSEHRNRFQ